MKFLLTAAVTILTALKFSNADDSVIVTVNGSPITVADVETMMRRQEIPQSLRATVRKTFVQRLIEYRLMRDYLNSQKVEPTKVQLEAAVRRVHARIRAKGKDPKAVLKRRGLDDAALKKEIWLPVAWNAFARQIISRMEIKDRFQKNRRNYDGTQRRASQIILKLPKTATNAQKSAAVKSITSLRAKIAAGSLSFAAAAKKHSQAPSRVNGGDIGFFTYRGKMPLVIARVAFQLKKGELSKPFVTPFGVHLLKVTEEKPGQLSLEDVRPELFSEIARERWNATVARLRKTAKIEWKSKP